MFKMDSRLAADEAEESSWRNAVAASSVLARLATRRG